VRQVALEAADRDLAGVEFAPRIARSDLFLAAGGQALLHTLQHRSTNTLLSAETLVYSIIAHLLRHHTARPYVLPAPESRLSKALLGRLLEYIHAHLGEPLTLAELAAIVHLSPYHLARQFRATVGQTPHQYVLAQRLVAARLLIGERTLPLAAIAARLGFADQSHLNFHFKRRYRITPGELARR
jgi:AraC family transcriptional regulator